MPRFYELTLRDKSNLENVSKSDVINSESNKTYAEAVNTNIRTQVD